MASRKKTTKKPASKADEVIEAVAEDAVVEETVRDDAADEVVTSEPVDADLEETLDAAADEEMLDNTLAEADPEVGDPAPEAEIAASEDDVSDVVEEPTPPMPTPQPEPVIIRKGGFFPLLLGGVAAAAIGFGAARYVLPEGWPWPGASDDAFEQEINAKLAAQAEAIDAVKAAKPDLSGIEDQIGGIQAAVDTLSGRIGDVSEKITGYEARLTEIEARPITQDASPAAVAAYERQLQALQDAMAAQRAEIESIAREAEDNKASAEMTAQEAMKRSALSQIQTAIDSGAEFTGAVESLAGAGIDVPEVLANAADTGVETQSALVEAFPEAARNALKAARKDEGGGFGAFLKTQLGARSLEPREGDDPDAVLSRAEAAVKEGRLQDAMAELDALPEQARTALTAWSTRVAARTEALAAVEALGAQVNSN